MSTVLGFDFGTKYIGVALGQTLTKVAKPLLSITRKNKEHDWKIIQELIEKYQPECLVVGKPLTLDGQEQKLTRLCAKFANRLRGRFNLPVFEEDERLTSMQAQAIIKDMKYRGNKKQLVDKIAAQIILQSWMDNLELDNLESDNHV